jgi:hypothetical protein
VKELKQQVDMLTQSNQLLCERSELLEDHARGLAKELADYKKLCDERFDKLTNLFLSLSK